MREEVSVRPDGSLQVLMHTVGPSKTRQEFKDECDLAKTVRKFCKTPEGRQALANAQGYVNSRFEDVSAVVDYKTAKEQINRSEAIFDALPAILRKRFGNDVGAFLQFVDDPKNLDEMRSLGLAKPVQRDAAKPSEPAKAG